MNDELRKSDGGYTTRTVNPEKGLSKAEKLVRRELLASQQPVTTAAVKIAKLEGLLITLRVLLNQAGDIGPGQRHAAIELINTVIATVDRLRDFDAKTFDPWAIAEEAAAGIERLRAALATARGVVDAASNYIAAFRVYHGLDDEPQIAWDEAADRNLAAHRELEKAVDALARIGGEK